MSTSGVIQFKVSVTVCDDETVCVVGNLNELGQWLPHRAVKLQKMSSNSDIWSGEILLPDDGPVEYRYMVASFVTVGEEEKVIVRRWETFIKPRTIALSTNRSMETASFGIHDGLSKVDDGWLIGMNEVRLSLHNKPIHMWKQQHQKLQYRVKVTTVDLQHEDPAVLLIKSHKTGSGDDDSAPQSSKDSCASVKLCVLNDEEACRFKEQQQFGSVYSENDVFIFKATTFLPENTGYMFDFYQHNKLNPNDVPERIGFAHVLPSNLKDSEGEKFVPITSLKHLPIGQLKVNYLVIKPLSGYECIMETSYRHHWKRSRRPLDVGHRGMGSYYGAGNVATLRENTIASLNRAGSHGADMVELDVHLSKDLVPIVYHDYTVNISMKKKKTDKYPSLPRSVGSVEESYDLEEQYEIPVKDLTVNQLQQLKLCHSCDKRELHTDLMDDNDVSLPSEISPSVSSDNLDDHRVFPTLEDVLHRVNIHVGFTIEVKYPMEVVNGEHELDVPYFEKNLFVDRILQTVLEHGGKRRIVFLTFEPDICIMLQNKQNKYPVLFITMRKNDSYDSYVEPRASDFTLALNFAVAEKLLGLAFYAGCYEEDREQIQHAFSKDLILFGWGLKDNKDISSLKKLGLDGVIIDRIEEHKTGVDHQANIFLTEYFEKMRKQLHEQGHLVKTTSRHRERSSDGQWYVEGYRSNDDSEDDEHHIEKKHHNQEELTTNN